MTPVTAPRRAIGLDATFTVVDRADSEDLLDLVRGELGLSQRVTLPPPGHLPGDLLVHHQCQLPARGTRAGDRIKSPYWFTIG
jgi:hypothetical protein